MEPADSSPPPPRDTPEQDLALARSEDQSRERVSAYDLMVVEGDLEGLNRKKEEMHKIFEQIHEKASSVLEFSLRWEEIDEQYGSMGDSLKQRALEMELKEKSVMERFVELEKKEERVRLVDERERKIEAFITECLSSLEEKEIESDLKLILEANVLRLVLQMQNEQVVFAQLNAQEKLLGLLHSSMMKKHEEVIRELEARKEEVALLSKSIDEKSWDLEIKVKEFDLKQKAETDRRRKEAELMEISLKQLEGRENELSLLYDTIKEKSTELEKKEENFELRQHAEAREIEVKSKFLELKEKKLEEREKELELRWRKLEERSIEKETCKRSRPQSEPSLLAEKGRDAESLLRRGKKHKLITEDNHNVEEKCVLHGKISSASATEYEHTSEVKRREADEFFCIDKVDEDPEPFTCPDPDFNDFNNTMRSFAVGQVWALYDPILRLTIVWWYFRHLLPGFRVVSFLLVVFPPLLIEFEAF